MTSSMWKGGLPILAVGVGLALPTPGRQKRGDGKPSPYSGGKGPAALAARCAVVVSVTFRANAESRELTAES
jgi:hypothetical protein